MDPRSASRCLVVIAAAGALLGLARIAHADLSPEAQLSPVSEFSPIDPQGFSCCCGQSQCGAGCCPSGQFCNPLREGYCCNAGSNPCSNGSCCPNGSQCLPGGGCSATCPAGYPVPCGTGCCEADQFCNPQRSGFCCEPGYVGCASGACCPTGFPCTADGRCQGTCAVDCGNGQCCSAGNTCNPFVPGGGCCAADNPVPCSTGCCPFNNTCNTLNPQLCCGSGFPIPCSNTCCPLGTQCSSDGFSCVTTGFCSNPAYPTDCRNGSCCPFGDRCQEVLVGDVISTYCCIDIPDDEKGCCPSTSPLLADTLGGAKANHTSKSGASNKCKKSTKVRPFEVLQIAAASNGAPASFDVENHKYSVGFVLRGGKTNGKEVVLKVPLIQEDSNSSSLSVMIPAFVLSKKTNGKATAFLVTDGVMSEDCLTTVRIAKLPKSVSRKKGLVTQSWLRANQNIYTSAAPVLRSTAATPFVNPEILADVDQAHTNVQSLVQSFAPGMSKELAKAAKYSDSLVTGMLTAATNVDDPAFAAAAGNLITAMADATDANDPALHAAEMAYATTLLNPSGPSSQGAAKFTVACGAVTSAAVSASATIFAGSATRTSGVIDAQAAGTVICGSTIAATTSICGVTTLVAGGATPTAATTTYGRTLLRGSTRVAAHARINYPEVNLATARLCGCRTPPLERVITTCITVIRICDHIRSAAPRFCLPDTRAFFLSSGNSLCGNGGIDSGEECDPGAAPSGCGGGTTCESCRCVGTGDVRVTLLWDTTDDLDLHVIEPSTEEIYFADRSSATGGALDVDSNAGCGSTEEHPVENVYWNSGTAPRGTYTVKVDYYRHCGAGNATVPFTVKMVVDGHERTFPGSVSTEDRCGACSECNTCSTITTFTR